MTGPVRAALTACCACCLALAAGARGARAQDILPGVLSVELWKQHLCTTTGGCTAQPQPRPSVRGSRTGAALADDALRFSRDPEVSRRTRAWAAAEARADGGFRTFVLRTAVAGGANEQQFARLAERYGLRTDDAGDAVAVYLVGLWQRANAPERQPTADEVRGVRAQVRRAFAREAGGPAGADPAARQELGETFAHRAALGEYARDAALKARNAAALGRLRDDAAAEGRRVVGIDVRALTLGPTGLVGPGAPGAGAEVAEAAEAADAPPGAPAEGLLPAEAAPPPPPARRRAAAVPAAVPAASGVTSVAGGDIETVVLRFSMEVGVGGGMYGTYNPTILYRDGRAVNPGSTHPGDRGRWRRVGPRAVTVDWEEGQPSSWTDIGSGNYFFARPGTPGMRLDGQYSAIGGGGSADFVIVNSRTIVFRPDGTFSAASTAGGFGSGMAVGADRADAGRYRIDGWGVTFTHPDGRTERGLFFRYPDSEDVIGVGGPGGVRNYVKK